MEKSCPDHGNYEVIISNDFDTYQKLCQSYRKVTKPLSFNSIIDQGCPNDCGLCPDHDQHTCLAILEITSRCDLGCPVCLASCCTEGYDLKPEIVESSLKKLIHNEGCVTPVQISGGEPTLHTDLIAIISLTRALGFSKIELDTNGLALGHDSTFAERLKEAGLSAVYLQMDGLNPTISEFMRGRDLVEEKLRAIEHCKQAELQVTLSVTVVPHINDDRIWEMVRFGMEQRVTGVSFQSVTLSGRFPKSLFQSPERFTLGHFIREIELQSNGKLMASDLTPLPCPDPRCGCITYALIHQGELLPIKRFLREDNLLDLIADLSDWPVILREIGPGTRPPANA